MLPLRHGYLQLDRCLGAEVQVEVHGLCVVQLPQLHTVAKIRGQTIIKIPKASGSLLHQVAVSGC
jgi:hypothetical protein